MEERIDDNRENAEIGLSAPESELEPGAGFLCFGLCDELMQGVREAGFREPTPIQLKAIPEALKGRDLLGQALTGTGKTTASGLPSMERLKDIPGLQMLVVTQTR